MGEKETECLVDYEERRNWRQNGGEEQSDVKGGCSHQRSWWYLGCAVVEAMSGSMVLL